MIHTRILSYEKYTKNHSFDKILSINMTGISEIKTDSIFEQISTYLVCMYLTISQTTIGKFSFSLKVGKSIEYLLISIDQSKFDQNHRKKIDLMRNGR